MKPDVVHITDTGKEGVEKLLTRLQTVKKAEFLVGRHLSREDAITMTNEDFIAFAEETVDQLLPVYDIIIGRT